MITYKQYTVLTFSLDINKRLAMIGKLLRRGAKSRARPLKTGLNIQNFRTTSCTVLCAVLYTVIFAFFAQVQIYYQKYLPKDALYYMDGPTLW
jgi:hypothetical protein